MFRLSSAFAALLSWSRYMVEPSLARSRDWVDPQALSPRLSRTRMSVLRRRHVAPPPGCESSPFCQDRLFRRLTRPHDINSIEPTRGLTTSWLNPASRPYAESAV